VRPSNMYERLSATSRRHKINGASRTGRASRLERLLENCTSLPASSFELYILQDLGLCNMRLLIASLMGNTEMNLSISDSERRIFVL
jgi:hypothetical protein